MQFEIKNTKDEMEKSFNFYIERLDGVVVSKVRPSFLDRVEVDCYGSKMKIKQTAMINIVDNFNLAIILFDKSNEKATIKAIQESNLNVSCNQRNESIIITLPPVTEQRRKEMAKIMKEYAEETKISIRSIRRDDMKKIEKGELSQDIKKNYEKQIQDVTDFYIKKIDDLTKLKEQEILKF